MRFDIGLRLIQRCASEEDVAALVAGFFEVAAAFGFDGCAGGGWTGFGRARAYRFYFNTWPPDWLALYNESQLFFDDPLVLEAQRRMAPFLWREIEQQRSLSDGGARSLDLALRYGWADGLVVPVHGPAGYQGMVSLAAFRALDLTPSERSLLWVVALAIHDRCRTSPGTGHSSMPSPSLTKRETECMRWVAAGKTDWEIGQLLQISPSTVHFHIERVKRRLFTSSRTEAVALLVLHGAL